MLSFFVKRRKEQNVHQRIMFSSISFVSFKAVHFILRCFSAYSSKSRFLSAIIFSTIFTFSMNTSRPLCRNSASRFLHAFNLERKGRSKLEVLKGYGGYESL